MAEKTVPAVVKLVVAASALFCCLAIHGRATAASGPRRVTIAYAAISPIMGGVWMAKEIGAYEKRGLQADLVFIASGAVTVASLISGDLDMAVAASNAVIAAVSKGAPLVAVGSVTNRPGQTLWVISRRRILDESGRMANSVGGAGARIDALA